MGAARDRREGEPETAAEWGRPGLSRRERRIAGAAIEALLCDTRDGVLHAPAPSWRDRVVGCFDRSLGACSTQERFVMRLLLWLLELLPPLVVGRLSRMSRLSLPVRVAYYDALERHARWPLALLAAATKIPMLIGAFEEGDALRWTGFDRPSISTRRALARAPTARDARHDAEAV
jgi:hypothetical protein